MPRNIIRSRVVQACFAALLGFWPVAFILPREVLFDLVNGVALSLGAAVLWAYRRGVRASLADLRGGETTRADLLVLGIATTWVAVILRVGWLWSWRLMGEPEGGLDHVLVAYIAALASIGAALHLMAPGVIQGEIPRSSWATLGVAVLFGVILGASVALFV